MADADYSEAAQSRTSLKPRAIEKVSLNLEALSREDPALAGVKAMGRAQRAMVERAKNY